MAKGDRRSSDRVFDVVLARHAGSAAHPRGHAALAETAHECEALISGSVGLASSSVTERFAHTGANVDSRVQREEFADATAGLAGTDARQGTARGPTPSPYVMSTPNLRRYAGGSTPTASSIARKARVPAPQHTGKHSAALAGVRRKSLTRDVRPPSASAPHAFPAR
jgi:hypothetical protein